MTDHYKTIEQALILASTFGGTYSEATKALTALRELQGQQATSAEGEWRTEAVKWLRRKASDQQAINKQYPKHVDCYPSWESKVRDLNWLADDLVREQESAPFGLDAPQPAQQAQKPVGKVCINHQGAWASLTGPAKEDDLLYTGPQRELVQQVRDALAFAYNACESEWVQDEKIDPAISACDKWLEANP